MLVGTRQFSDLSEGMLNEFAANVERCEIERLILGSIGYLGLEV